MKQVAYQISERILPAIFNVGYCEQIIMQGDHVIVMYPFTEVVVSTSIHGSCSCRGKWMYPYRLCLEEFLITPLPYAPWMDLSLQDLLDVDQLLMGLETQLPREGFRRFFTL